MTDAAVVQIPRPKTPQGYDQKTTEQAFQSLERGLQNKHDKRGHLYLEPGKELVLTSDNSASQFGIGLDAAGYIRIRDMSDGSIGTFSVAWAQVDGAAQEITDLQAYVDAADATLTSSVLTNATAITANGVSIAGIETEITAARDGEADLAAKFSSVEGAFASADTAIASDVTALTARVTTNEGDITTAQSDIISEASTRATADSTAATDRTAIRSEFAASDATVLASANTYTDTEVTAEGAARATLQTAVEAGVYSPIGGNYAFNSAFEANFEGWKAGWAGDSGLTKGGALDLYGTASKRYYVAYLTGTPTSGDVYDILSTDGSYLGDDVVNTKKHALPVKAGDKVYASALLTASGISSVSVIIYWLQAAGTETGATTSVAASGAVGTAFFSSFDSYTRLGGIATAPAGAAFAQIYIRCTCDGAANPLAIATELQICKVPDTQTALPLYVPGRDSTGDRAAVTSILQEAFVDSDGNAYAGMRLVAAASGSDPAIIELTSADGSANVRLGGDTEIDGDLVVNGTITTEGLAVGAVTNSGSSQNAASTSLTSGAYVEVIDLDFTSVGIGVEIRASCDVEVGAFTPGSPSSKIDWELRSGTTVLKSGSTNGAIETTTPGGLTYNTVRGTVVVDYNDLPSSGTYNYNLRIEVTNGGGTPTQSATNRFISAREFKR